MENKTYLLSNIDKIHTTQMGVERIKKNLKINTEDVVGYCKEKIVDNRCIIDKEGKNYYCKVDHIIIVIHSTSFTIITAHKENFK